MTDAEISRRLALAIGWEESDIIDYPGQDYVGIRTSIVTTCVRLFSFKFPTVIWPIAERLDCFPEKMRSGGLWAAPVFDAKANGRPPYPMLRWEYSDTAAKAVALAVIKHCEGGKTS